MASRRHEGNLGRRLSPQELKYEGGAVIADYLKLEDELREIFSNLSHGDPRVSGADGNFGGVNLITVTTPAAINQELAVAHLLGRAPVGMMQVVPLVANASFLGSLYVTKVPDTIYLYVAVAVAADTSKSLTVRVW